MLIVAMLIVAMLIVAVLLVGGLIGSAGSAQAQPTESFTDVGSYPQTPAGRRAEELVAVLSAGDREQMRAYTEEHFAPSIKDIAPMEEQLVAYDDQYAKNRGYDFHATRKYTPSRPETTCVVILRNRITELWDALIVEVEAEAPNRVAKMHLATARRPRDLAPEAGPLSAAQVADELGAFLDRLGP
jgi:hypothetical protein